MSLVWDTSDDQMEKCIREIEKSNWIEVHAVFDDTINGVKQFFYIFEEPFGLFLLDSQMWNITALPRIFIQKLNIASSRK
uniref:DUF4177 domain-containing protein n=1 Tax=Elaeophora elaphi TaxID=1147741 RepID=A0A0R3RVG2_9BILA